MDNLLDVLLLWRLITGLRVEAVREKSLSQRFGVVEEEADESAFWLEIIIEGESSTKTAGAISID